MTRNAPYARLARGGAVVAVIALTGVVLWLLVTYGYTGLDTGLTLLVAALAWAGVVALLRDANGFAIAVAVGLVFVGVWQTAIWMAMLPAAGLLALAGILAGQEPAQAHASAE